MVEELDDMSDYADLARLSVVSAGVIVFIILIGVDTWRALKKGAHWIPGDLLVLSALIIQAMNLLKVQGDMFRQSEKKCEGLLYPEEQFRLNNHYDLVMTHVNRVMLCVLVAYLLPGMVRPGSKEPWGKLAALGLNILLHICTDFLNLQSGSYYEVVLLSTFGIEAGLIIAISLVCLILLLSCATMANKSIRDIIGQKIPVILAQQSNGHVYSSWKAVEGQVFKSWIVARACYPEAIIARSVLSSSAGLTVTICIVSSVIGLVTSGPLVISYNGNKLLWFKAMTTILEVVFIVIGWAIICWRWVSSVAYYGRWGSKGSWRDCFLVEDFWTRGIVERQEPDSSPIDGTIQKMEIKLISTEQIEIYLPRILFRCLYWLQFLVVFISKGCWRLSELMFLNKVMIWLSSLFLSKDKEGSEYERILENVDFLWETPSSVFEANRKSILKAMKLLIEGNEDGGNCHALLRFLTDRKSEACVGKRCLDPRAALDQAGAHQTDLKFLCKLDPGPKLDLEQHFMYARKKSWKLTAISLVNIIIRLSADCGKDCLEAYSEAWQVMGVVDDYDQGTDSLLSKAADGEFKALQSGIAAAGKALTAAKTMQEAARDIDKLALESKTIAEVNREGKDSLDWKKAAAGNALYKLCKSIDCTGSDVHFTELINELQSALADIIACCIEKVGSALVENCGKWAQELDETKLVQALYLAGRSRGLMEKLEWSPNVHIGPAMT